MTQQEYAITYPRRRIARGLTRTLGRLVLRLAFKVRVVGKESFPHGGPLLVVGNHTAAMEAVLMAVFTPWQVEMLGAGDIPEERITEISKAFFGYIPINRGHVDRTALRKALDVLRQGGVLGLFPEGGIWEPGAKQAQTGVAWLSYRSNAPVLPIYFSDTTGTLQAALSFERPEMSMRVGKPIPAARLPEGKPRKVYLQEYANRVMDAVRALAPPDVLQRQANVVDERFQLEIALKDASGNARPLPSHLTIDHARALAKFLHRPAILKIFRSNLEMPIQPLESLHQTPTAENIVEATQPILAYLNQENPYLLTYRFGPKEAEAMQLGLEELLTLAAWAIEEGLTLQIVPIRRYYAPDQDQEVVQTRQGKFDHWM